MNLGKLGQAFTAREIFDLIQDDLERVEKKIAVESVASADAVTAIGQYLQSSGGKRLRPALLLLSAKLANPDGSSANASAIQMGAVVEMIHAATLVHDDVIDAAETRRGRPSTNMQVGQSHLRAGGRLALHAGFPDRPAGAEFSDSRSADRRSPR